MQDALLEMSLPPFEIVSYGRDGKRRVERAEDKEAALDRAEDLIAQGRRLIAVYEHSEILVIFQQGAAE